MISQLQSLKNNCLPNDTFPSRHIYASAGGIRERLGYSLTYLPQFHEFRLDVCGLAVQNFAGGSSVQTSGSSVDPWLHLFFCLFF